MEKYDHKKIEARWQKNWSDTKLYQSQERGGQPKCYVLDMFPYPSGEGLHVGHPKGYIATDVYSRYKQMCGFNILHPMGWDAFGLPAENYAIKNKVHPRVAVEENISRFKKQLDLIGLNYDWTSEINTTDPEYYRWTQWIFLKLLEKGLAYQSYEPINWCPSCQTGLANEDLEGGKCERCSSVVEKKPMRQWVLKIRDYADRLLADLDAQDDNGKPLLNWPSAIKESQKNWIGRSEGAEFEFKIVNSGEKVSVFTTRADTLFGVTYLVLAPEHSLIQKLKAQIKNWSAVEKYLEKAKTKDEIERTSEGREKAGVVLDGIFAINPASQEKVPVWIADYVLATYGTGAVMAVPAHDERDWEFAKRYNLPTKEVVAFFYAGTGVNQVRPTVETLHREVVDVVAENKNGEILLIKENTGGVTNIHFLGGGTDGEDYITAVKREFVEETGYTEFEILGQIPGGIFSNGYRHTKGKNQETFGYAHHLKVMSDKRVRSEVEEGKHSLMWVKKDEVAKLITWPHHLQIWQAFLKKQAFISDGRLLNSNEFDGLSSQEAREKITEKFGKKKVTYKLRDWVFSRQRYWGEPIPIIHCEKCGVVPVPEKDLPVRLPEVESYAPTGTGESPLASISDWVNTICPKCGASAKRETNTMPQWAGSSWYYLAYVMKGARGYKLNARSLLDKWLPVDLYIGGAEHATRHLIYARFWHKFLFDIGIVGTLEPFTRLQNVGLIMAEDGRKMGKRYGNVVNPDDIVANYGADTLRIYEMFMGPFDQAIAWSRESLIGPRRFLEKVWRLRSKVTREGEGSHNSKLTVLLHQTIKKVSEDIEAMRFNTAISSLMILLNEFESAQSLSRQEYESLLLLLAPFAPHITEELWESLGNEASIHLASWPKYDSSKLEKKEVSLVVQVNGVVRDSLKMSADLSPEEIEKMAQQSLKIKKWLEGKSIKKIIHVKHRLVNFVV